MKVKINKLDFALVVRNVGDAKADGYKVSVVFPDLNPNDQVSGMLANLTTIAICLDKQEPEFMEMIGRKFNEFASDSRQLKIVK